jgi:hypothetical protein
VCGRFGRITISPSVPRGNSLSSSSKMRTSKYSSLMTPAALGLFSTPGGCHEMRLASVTPYAPLNVVTPNRVRITSSTSVGIGAAPISRRVVFASGSPERGISGRSTSWARR